MSNHGCQTVADELFAVDPDGARLIGTRCTSCGAAYFPQTASCRNPACAEKRVERALLSPHGRLYSWTVQAYRPPPPFQMDDWQPYAIGLVDIDDGLRVLGMLDVPEDRLAIGMKLRVAARPLSLDQQGRPVMTYCFIADGSAEQA